MADLIGGGNEHQRRQRRQRNPRQTLRHGQLGFGAKIDSRIGSVWLVLPSAQSHRQTQQSKDPKTDGPQLAHLLLF